MCTVNFEEKYLMLIEMLFDIHTSILFQCNCILLQRCCLFCYQIKLTKNQRYFFYCNNSVLYIFFDLSQLLTVYPFGNTEELKQSINMYTTSLTVKHYFKTFHDLRPQTALMRYHVSRNTLPYTVPEILSSLGHFKW